MVFMLKDVEKGTRIIEGVTRVQQLYDIEQYFLELKGKMFSDRGLYNVADYDSSDEMLELLHSGEKYVNIKVDPETYGGSDTLKVVVINVGSVLEALKVGEKTELAIFNDITLQDELIEVTRVS